MALTIARRELAERRFFFVTAGILALMPFAAALLPDANRFGYADFVAVVAGALAIGIPLAGALILGVTTVGRELAERRMSFYFSKPIGAVPLWTGKLLAALITITASYAIILVPTLLFFNDRWARNWGFDIGLMAAFVIGGALVLFLIAHCISTVLRSRSAWVALDLALLALTFALAWLIVRPLLAVWAAKLVVRIGYLFAGLTFVVLLLSGGYQLVYGRTDARRNHAALSRFLWIAMAIVLAICAGIVAWIVTPEPVDLVDLAAEQPAAGRWAMLGGDARGRMDYYPAFLIDVESGAHHRLGALAPFFHDTPFSRDGRRLVMAKSAFSRTRFELVVYDVESGRKRETNISLKPFSTLVLSDDGTRVAAFDGTKLTVYELGPDKLLASMRVADSNVRSRAQLYFRDRDTVRIHHANGDRMTFFECRIAAKQLIRLGQIRDGEQAGVNRDGSRMLLRRFHPLAPSTAVTDAGGKVIFELAGSRNAGRFRAMRLLEDDRIVVVETIGGEAHLSVYDSEGTRQREPINLGKSTGTYLAAELAGGKVAVTTARAPFTKPSVDRGWTTLIVDVNSGAIERRLPLRPMTMYQFGSDPRQLRRDGSLLFEDAQGSLVRWNPATNEQKVLVKGAG